MTCLGCKRESAYRFCSDACFLAYSKTRLHVECAICQYDPVTGSIGNHRTHRRCQDCQEADENDDWCEPSIYEQRTDDVDTLVGIVGGGTLAEVFGGARKGNDAMAARVVAAAKMTITVRRRRRNANGQLLRGWVHIEVEPTLRDIAKAAGCSHEQARRILKRIGGE